MPCSAMPAIGELEHQRQAGIAGIGRETSFVEGVGNKLTHGRMKPPRPLEEDAAIGPNRGSSRRAGSQESTSRLAGMDGLGRLAQLHLVADEDDVPSRDTHRDDVRHRYLTGLVDEQVIEMLVESLMGKEPGCPGQ